MKHIILAAGIGTRLFPITLKTPKVLLPVLDTTLLANQVNISLRISKISKIEIVAGYMSEQMHEYVDKNWEGEDQVNTLYNPDFRINNPIYSLTTAIAKLPDSDFLITNGDVWYEQSLIRNLISSDHQGITMIVSPYRDHSNRAMTVHVSDDRLVAIYPHAPESHSYESPGIILVRGIEARDAFYKALKKLSVKYAGLPHFWHDILNEVKIELPIMMHKVTKYSWSEVDDQEGLSITQEMVSRRKNAI